MSAEREEMAALDAAFDAPVSKKMKREAEDVFVSVDDSIREKYERAEEKKRWEGRVRSDASMAAMATRACVENGNPHVHVFKDGACVACGRLLLDFDYIRQFCGTGRVRFGRHTYFVSESGEHVVRIK